MLLILKVSCAVIYIMVICHIPVLNVTDDCHYTETINIEV